MTYDQWKTTDPRDDGTEEEDEATELQRVYDDLYAAQRTIKFLRERIASLEAKYEPEEPF